MVPGSDMPSIIPSTMDHASMQVTQAPMGSIGGLLSGPPELFSSASGSGSMTAPIMPHAEPMGLSVIAASNISGGTSGSNAFEEPLDAFSFGAEPSWPDSWTAFVMSSDWLDMGGHLPPDST